MVNANQKMWFGTRDLMQYIPCPAINMDASKKGYSNQVNYLSGAAYIQSSIGSHKEYDMSWNLSTRDDIRIVTDYADSLFGTGPIYWADPFVMDKNMLPQYWASPFQGAYDGPILDGNVNQVRPTTISTPTNPYSYPLLSAVYTVSALATPRPSVWIPIPPGYTVWVGANGANGTGGTVVATPTTGATTVGTAVTLTILPVTSATRVNQSFNYSAGYTGVLISLGGTGTVTLSGLIVQLLPTGTTPGTGSFISGQGNSGCQFYAQPSVQDYSAAWDKVGASARLVETAAWQ